MENSFLMFFDLIAIGCGVYMLYTWYKLKLAGRLFPNALLIPKDKSPKSCADPEGYIRYIQPRTLITGIFITVFGIINMVNEYAQFYGLIGSEILVGVNLVVIIWYGVCYSKAVKLYW